MAAKKEKRLFRVKDAVKNSEGKYGLFGLSTGIHKDTLDEKLKSGEWIEVDPKTGKDKTAPASGN